MLQLAAEHLRAGRLDQAEKLCRRALEVGGENPDAYHFLGLCCLHTGRLEDSLAHLRRAIQMRPGKAEYHNTLGGVYSQSRQYAQGVHHFWQAIALEPDYVAALSNLARTLRTIGYTDEAQRIDRRRIAIDPRSEKDSGAVFQSGRGAQENGELAKAVACYRRAIELSPGYFPAHQYLGQALWQDGRIHEAIEAVEQSLSVKPGHTETLKNLAVLYLQISQSEESAEASRRAVEMAPDYAQGYLTLAHSKRFSADDPDLAVIEAGAKREGIKDGGRILLDFALGKAYEDAGEYQKAFDHFRRGNALQRPSVPYSREATVAETDALIDFFTADRLAELGGRFADASDLPVFIVGMPRSATTLVEQILASHRQVYGGGELDHLRLVKERSASLSPGGLPFPQCLGVLAPAAGRKLAADHVDTLARMGGGASRVSDKMPINYLHVGLIRLFWPNAKIVHCMRDPMDTCLSCYTRYFVAAQPFSWDLADVGQYYRQYERLMSHWREVLPGEMFEVSYEHLVENTEQVTRELIAFCGLPWDDACLEFHQSKRPIRTNPLSARRPIYSSSVGRWRRYEEYLQPLREALDGS